MERHNMQFKPVVTTFLSFGPLCRGKRPFWLLSDYVANGQEETLVANTNIIETSSESGKKVLENSRVFGGVQIATGIAVVFGLVLVVFELQQTRELTRLQLAQESLTVGMSEYTARYGENVGEHIAAACLGSPKLTEANAVVLDSVFSYQMWWIARQKQRWERDLGGNNPWEDEALRRMEYIAGFPRGIAWLERYHSRDPEIQKFVERATLDIEPKPCTDLFELFSETD